MKNTLRVQVDYSFKGENFNPSILLEIEEFAKHNRNFAGLYRKIAQHNKIDTYSYAYEVMETSTLIFSDPKGNIVDFVDNGSCDLAAYKRYLKQDKMYEALEKIAADILGVNDLFTPDNNKIKAALVSAYRAGREKE
jgi:hypothetical protein